MFRITRGQQAGARILRLEGSLTSQELPLLDASLAEDPAPELTLDLSGVSWLDAQAAARLNALRAAGAVLTACSPFLHRLLGQERA